MGLPRLGRWIAGAVSDFSGAKALRSVSPLEEATAAGTNEAAARASADPSPFAFQGACCTAGRETAPETAGELRIGSPWIDEASGFGFKGAHILDGLSW